MSGAVDEAHLTRRPARTRTARLLIELAGALRGASVSLSREAEALAAREGLSAARAEVLAASAGAERPQTVSDLARALGLARQSVQRTADLLLAEGFCAAAPNPGHRRAPFIVPTAAGHAALERLENARIAWANQASLALAPDALRQAAVILEEIAGRRS
ncbi:MAG: MarR family transcriptional regulator [Alphaproteobacteria bacterium]|nr:MarR family transcriptional regulator [Alphaproteobacteria bacterium]